MQTHEGAAVKVEAAAVGGGAGADARAGFDMVVGDGATGRLVGQVCWSSDKLLAAHGDGVLRKRRQGDGRHCGEAIIDGFIVAFVRMVTAGVALSSLT